MKYERWYWLNSMSERFLYNGYIKDDKPVKDRVREMANRAEEILGIDGFSDKFVDYMSRGWYTLSSPVWANFGLNSGLPISCFNTHVSDSMESILEAGAEIGIMSKYGGGTSLYLGDIRARGTAISTGGRADGPVHYLGIHNAVIDKAKQADTRRGNCAVYLPASHPDIWEFLDIKTEGHPIQNLQYGVCFERWWMEEMLDGDSYKKDVWARVIQNRMRFGYPYIFFTDNVNDGTCDIYKDNEMKINSSNLCTECLLPSTEEESFSCNTNSLNLRHYDEWKDTDAIETLVYFCDAIETEFIEKGKGIRYLERAVKFAERHRALGVGVAGLHYLYQSKMIPFASLQAKLLNKQIFKHIQEKCYKASRELYEMFGGTDLTEKYGRRNTCLNFIAPTKSSSFIIGQTSLGIEPQLSNYYVKDIAKIQEIIKNPYLVELLEGKNKNTMEVWDSIMKKGGSVQHLEFLSDDEKDVFKTVFEIPQMELVRQAADRQEFIDQGQSLNVFVHPKTSPRDINMLYLEGYKAGIKTFYYHHSKNFAQDFANDLMECVACSG